MADCKYDPTDFNLELSWIAEVPLEERFALLMQANFAELGIKSEIKKLPWALFAEQVSKPENTPHVSQLFVNALTGDPDTLLYGMYHSSAAGTWQSPEYLDDSEVDKALEEGRSAGTEEGRAAAYTKLNQRLMDIAPTVYGYDRQSVFAASNRVNAPALSDPSQAFGLDGMGFSFRLMEVEDQSPGPGRAFNCPSRLPTNWNCAMSPVVRLLAKRLGTSLLVLIGVSMLTFAIARVIPGDPARIALGPNATAEQIMQLREELHLDDPVWEQYGNFLVDLARGDLGISLYTNRPVTTDIAQFLPATLVLVLAAGIMMVGFGLQLGILSARYRVIAAALPTTPSASSRFSGFRRRALSGR